MNAAIEAIERELAAPTKRDAVYRVVGQGLNGGAYNSHIVFLGLFVALAASGVVDLWLLAWVGLCLTAALFADDRSWRRKLALKSIPSQSILYAQVAGRSFWDALPHFMIGYVLYVCVAPVWSGANVAVSSFVMLYGFYMLVRILRLGQYMWLIRFRWDNALSGVFAVHEANLKSRSSAMRHVLWAYFLGNVGLVVRCSPQVVTIGAFEFLRQSWSMDLTQYPAIDAHRIAICVVASVAWPVVFALGLQKSMLVFYRAHRAFHTCRPLYDSVHAIHHRGVLPTRLDAGTESPWELAITELVTPVGTLVPNWMWVGGQIVIGMFGHLPGHDTGSRRFNHRHHVLHHRYFNVNFGLLPRYDKRYDTLYVEQDLPSSETAGTHL